MSVATHLRTARGNLTRIRNRPALRAGYLLTATSALTSVIGLGYWVLAARLYPASVVGLNAAAVYAMSFLAGLVQLSATSVVLRFVPDNPGLARKIILVTSLVVAALSALAALVYLAGLRLFSPTLQPLLSGWSMSALFVLATVVWALFVQQSAALVATGRPGAVPLLNTVFAVAKVALVVLAAAIPAVAGIGVLWSWTIGTTLAAVLSGWYLVRRAMPAFAARTDVPAAATPTGRELGRYAGPNLLGSLAWTATTTLSPVLVLGLVGAQRGAVFALALSTCLALTLIASSFAQGLLAHGDRRPAEIEVHFREVLGQCALVTTAGVVVVFLTAHWILGLYGSWYAEQGTTLVRLLAASAVPNAVLALALARWRVLRQVWSVAVVQLGLCVLTLGLTVIVVPRLGLTGAGLVWLVSQTLAATGCLVWHRIRRVRRVRQVRQVRQVRHSEGVTTDSGPQIDPHLPYRRLEADVGCPGWAEDVVARLAQAPPDERSRGVHLLLRRAGVPIADALVEDPAALTASGWRQRLDVPPPSPSEPVVRPAETTTTGPGRRLTATVVICTRGRPDGLRRCLLSLTRQTDPDFEVLVVDNNDRPDAGVAAAVDLLDGVVPARSVHQGTRGLSHARNTALIHVRTELALWLDDDEEADASWVEQVRAAFAADPETAAISGRVLPARLQSRADLLFEEFGGHNKGRGWRAERFLRDDLGSEIYYPLPAFGVGANLATRTSAARAVGFDPHLGAGSACGGAEDTLFFSELLETGALLRYVPQALTWHHHRSDDAGLAGQLDGYGAGIGGFYAALLWSRPSRLVSLIRLVPRALREQADPDSLRNAGASAQLVALRSGNRRAIVRGALRYSAARMKPGRVRPVRPARRDP